MTYTTGNPRPGPERISKYGSVTTSTRLFAAAFANPRCNACTNSTSASRRRIRSVRYGRNKRIVVKLGANIQPFGDQSQLRGRQIACVIEYRVMKTTVKHPEKSCRTRSPPILSVCALCANRSCSYEVTTVVSTLDELLVKSS